MAEQWTRGNQARNTKGLQIQILLFFCLFVLGLIISNCNAQNLITINANVKYQTMVGWDVMGQAGAQGDLFYQTNMENQYRNFRDTLMTLLVDEAGINMIQVELRCGQENSTDYWQSFWTDQSSTNYSNWKINRYIPLNDNADPYSINWRGFQFSELDSTISQVVLPLKERLAASRQESLYVYLNYLDFTSSAFEHRSNPAEYAEFIEAAVEHIYNTWGFYVNGINIINEPDNGIDPGWSNGATVGNCTKALIDRIQSRGWDIDIIAPATLSMGQADNFFDNIWNTLADDDTSYIKLLAYHRYAGISADLQNIEERVLAHPLLGGFMNEWWDYGNNHETLHEDLKNGANSAWQQGIACSPFSGSKTPLFRVDTTQSPPHVYLAEKTKYTMLYCRYVRSGAVRIEAATTNNDFDPIAFINKKGNYVVVVKVLGSGSFGISGLPSGSYGITYTTPLEYDVDLPDITINEGEPLNASIPYEGVIAIHQKPVNHSPVKLDTIPNMTYLEDSGPNIIVKNLNMHFLDPDSGDFLQFESFSDNNNIRTAISNDTLKVNSAANYFGIATIVVNAIDNGGLSISDTLSVRIKAVNDPPSISNIPDLIFHQDSSFTIDLDTYVTDVDNDTSEINWTAQVQSAHLLFVGPGRASGSRYPRRPPPIKPPIHPSDLIVTIDSTNHRATFKTVNGKIGWFSVEIKATDSGGLMSSDKIKVTATPFALSCPNNNLTSIGENQTAILLPAEYRLNQNYPNPFNPSTTIEFQIPQNSYVYLTIYNLQGQKIQTLINDELKAGYYSEVWNGLNASGIPASSGIYLYQIKTDHFQSVRKMILVR